MFGLVESVSFFDGKTQKPTFFNPDYPRPAFWILREKYIILIRATYKLDKEIHVQPIAGLRSSMRLLNALDKCSTAALMPTLLQPSLVSQGYENTPILSNIKFNASQKSVINDLTQFVENGNKDAIKMVHGPPGSGKSHTILGLGLQIYLRNKQDHRSCRPILVCGPSNGAVDAIVRKYMKHKASQLGTDYDHLQMVRIGGQNIAKDVKEISLQNIAKREYNSYNKDQRKATNFKGVKKAVISRANIIFGTLNSFESQDVEHLKNLLCIIVDEACQANEMETLVPLQFPGTTHLILFGDHHQLPPTILSNVAKSLHYGISLFERLEKVYSEYGRRVDMLDTQYRMVPEISKFPAAYIYENKLLTPHPDDPISFYNKNEAEIITKICQQVVKDTETKPEDIGVITFYKAQLEVIRINLKKAGLHQIEVNTVDGFQGREKDVIVLSTVRVGKGVGFLTDRRRLNVAITRAKFGQYIIMHVKTLQQDSNWKALIDDAQQRNLIQNAYQKREE